MSKCLTCKYATPDGLCLAKGKFTVLDADACETYAPIMEHELAALRRENAKLRELCKRFAEYVSQDKCEGCVCKRRCNDGEIDECWQRTEIRKAAHEFGIEVD